MAVGWMMSVVKRRNHEMDPIEELLWKLWERLKISLRKFHIYFNSNNYNFIFESSEVRNWGLFYTQLPNKSGPPLA